MPITADVSAPRAPSTIQVTNVQSIIGPYARCRIILLYRITAPTADYALSKINTDYETSLYAAMASFIIHIYF